MAWLSFWRTLLALGFEEAIIASCQFGCLHREEFRFLVYLLDAVFLEARCQGGHHHIRIEGKWTTGSAVTKDLAVYMDGLRKHLASTFAKALRLESTDDELVVHGFESLLVNDFVDSSHWTLGKVWDWKKHAHINAYETNASVVALESQLAAGFCCRLLGCEGCLVKGSQFSKEASASFEVCLCHPDCF